MMFFAGIGPGILLSVVYCLGIVFMAYFTPGFVYDRTGRFSDTDTIAKSNPKDEHSLSEILVKFLPLAGLVTIVLGGIYGGIFTPTEAGAIGAISALILAVVRRKMDWKAFWKVLLETGHITAAICFLIIAATMYSRSLAMAGVPTEIGELVRTATENFLLVLLIYIIVVLILGTIIDSISIILIMVPLFLPIMQGFGVDPIWFGIITVIAVEVGLLTPPLGIACFVIKGSLDDQRITLGDVFIGAMPFALMMLFILALLTIWPHLVYINQWM